MWIIFRCYCWFMPSFSVGCVQVSSFRQLVACIWTVLQWNPQRGWLSPEQCLFKHPGSSFCHASFPICKGCWPERQVRHMMILEPLLNFERLYINDFNLDSPNAKVNGMIKLVKSINAVPFLGRPLIDGIGTQVHLNVSLVNSLVMCSLNFISVGWRSRWRSSSSACTGFIRCQWNCNYRARYRRCESQWLHDSSWSMSRHTELCINHHLGCCRCGSYYIIYITSSTSLIPI